MSILSTVLSYVSVGALKTGLLAIPGANYVLIAWEFLSRYWKPIAIAIALGYSFHLGVVHEAKKNQTAQLTAQVVKVTFERDNLVKAAKAADIELGELDNLEDLNRRFVDAIKSKPIVGDCVISDDVARRLQQRNPGRARPSR